jgi:hypothetical protein
MRSVTGPTVADTDTDTDPAPVADTSDAHLREVVRDVLREMLPGGDGEAEPAPESPAEGEPEGPANMTLRQMTERAFQITAAAIDKIPGAAPKNHDPKPVVEKPPASRAMRFLGFHDPEVP